MKGSPHIYANVLRLAMRIGADRCLPQDWDRPASANLRLLPRSPSRRGRRRAPVARDLKQVSQVGQLKEPEKVTGKEGKSYEATKKAEPGGVKELRSSPIGETSEAAAGHENDPVALDDPMAAVKEVADVKTEAHVFVAAWTPGLC